MKIFKWLYPGLEIKRWLVLVVLGIFLITFGIILIIGFEFLSLLEQELTGLIQSLIGDMSYLLNLITAVVIILIGISFLFYGVTKMINSIIEALLPNNEEELIELLYQERSLKRGPKIVVIGGGTGLPTMLRGIKKFSSNITAVVTVADDGGSSGVLRDELDILPPGDIRNCLVALADTEVLMEKLFQYRFSEGQELDGHSFGNLFIATMSKVLGDFEAAVKESSKVLAIKGRVLPSTLADVVLHAETESGRIVKGESKIPEAGEAIQRVFLKPEDCESLTEVTEAISEADAVILGPGSLYTSVIPNLLVTELATAVKETSALKIYSCNIMTQPGETVGYSVADHVQALYDHAGSEIVDYVLVNNEEIPTELLAKYEEEGAAPVEVDSQRLKDLKINVVQAPLLNKDDLVRHNPQKLAKVIMELISRLKKHDEQSPLLDLYLRSKAKKDRW
ncbi:gluconeogenesis factor YvcK family protein [Fuchsiella alkaliacetigena]|uniref:gluconeogenesis factor YvcK family protein n=1 Tax=Fuchsiella alkaliacetigena TaxID=957042 RepID=UPI00200A927A|nr:YvcK family protein [Fuchsiella alkaliacetigena]MCK8824848.1 YvcK family protein [Fuchsiella alkaliacetigena]